jgi:8-oxo-dGTP pyrophosphatase MutT (NUDIX family)
VSLPAAGPDGGVPDHASVVARLRARLRDRAPRTFALPDHQPAAVAVLLVERGGATYLPFTVRTDHLRKHSGQISFPGGRRDASDASFAHCAVREASEELAIDSARVTILGELDEVPTPTGFVIRPVVAELRPGGDYQPNPGEVAEVFEVPLFRFLDPGAREELGERDYLGVTYRLFAYRIDDRKIWGATARIVEQLLEIVTA